MKTYCLGYTHEKCKTCQHERTWQTLNKMPSALRLSMQKNMSRIDSDRCRLNSMGLYKSNEGAEMKTAAVVIDRYKLETFKRHLTTAGYSFTEHPGVTPDTLTLRVEYELVSDLQPIIVAANKESTK